MIAKGSDEEARARRHLAMWQGMIVHWNKEADAYRLAARSKQGVARHMLEEADTTLLDLRHALELCDGMTDRLPPGHELRGDMLRIGMALSALAESLEVSVEQLGPRVAVGEEIAGLRYLVSALRQNARQVDAA